MVIIMVNFIVHFAGEPYGKLLENMVSFIINMKFFSHRHLIEFYEINRMSHVPHLYDIVILLKQPPKYLTVMTSSAMVFAGHGMVKERPS